MDASTILDRLAAHGVKLRRNGSNLIASPKTAMTDELRAMIRTHRAELLAALASDALPDPGAEARKQRVLAMLAERPTIPYAVVTDDQTDPAAVLVALGIRGALPGGSIVTCELRIPRAKYDPLLLLDLIERHGGTMH